MGGLLRSYRKATQNCQWEEARHLRESHPRDAWKPPPITTQTFPKLKENPMRFLSYIIGIS
jgi:hypothetical protein